MQLCLVVNPSDPMDSAKPMVTETALMGHKTRQSCDYGKEICKERSGELL